MAQHKNFNELVERLNNLSVSDREKVLIFVETEINGKPLFKPRPEIQTFNLPIRLTDNPNLSEDEIKTFTAQSSAFHAEAIFWILKQFSQSIWDNNDKIGDVETTFQNLTFICEIGIALARNCSDFIDQSELVLFTNNKSDSEDK